VVDRQDGYLNRRNEIPFAIRTLAWPRLLTVTRPARREVETPLRLTLSHEFLPVRIRLRTINPMPVS
jgi:hypothetical protein